MHAGALLGNDPQAYHYFATSSYLPIYHLFFGTVVPLNVTLFTLAAILTELTIGLLIFSHGRAV